MIATVIVGVIIAGFIVVLLLRCRAANREMQAAREEYFCEVEAHKRLFEAHRVLQQRLAASEEYGALRRDDVDRAAGRRTGNSNCSCDLCHGKDAK